MEAPIYSRLIQYFDSDRVSFSMPGHKNGRGLDKRLIDCDVTELEATLNLYADDETVNEANRLLALRYRSDESYILTGGATSGIQAMLASVLNPGDTLLAASDCHMSVVNTCALCGYNMRMIPEQINEDFFIPGELADISRALESLQEVGAVIVTSPTYYGQCRDIASLAKVCHHYGVPLLVDEAHGAHFVTSSRFPKNAVRLGADASVNSAHKTLNALTGAAYLHVKGELINRKRLKAALHMFQSSSPSYVIAASADIARAQSDNASQWEELCDACMDFRQKIEGSTYIRFLDNDDPTRLVLNFTAYDTTGFDVLHSLSENYGIDAEMADMVNIVLIVTPLNTQQDFLRLYKALNDITDGFSVRREPLKILQPPVSPVKISPQKAFYSNGRSVSPQDAIGYVAASTVTAYPPGIPIIFAGEEISAKQILYIRYLTNIGADITGMDGGKIIII